ncbi:MAG TPA: hypothetical protein VER33_09120 [Polyangiaceae bacterium]|nr:hypothetical protein [Polyangiaceae bacterium]
MKRVKRSIGRPGARAGGALVAALGALFVPAIALAEPELRMEAIPMFGGTAPDDGGWRSLLVRLENPTSRPVSGSVQVHSRAGFTRRGPELTTSIPFALAPNARATIEAPSRGFHGNAAQLQVSARDTEGQLLAEMAISGARPTDALVLDLGTPSRMGAVLRGLRFTSTRSAPYARHARAAVVGVSSAPIDPATGDALLPSFAASYSAATLVMATGREFSRLAEPERAALARWILAGGAVALSLQRPEELTDPSLQTLLAGSATRAAPSRELLAPTLFWPASEDADSGVPVPNSSKRPLRLAPGNELAKLLTGFSGGNLRNTPWGASCSYGLGEVHLLAFDTGDPVAVQDPWARHKLLDLVRHAFDRQQHVVLRSSSSLPGTTNVEGVRRELDPNQASRWTIVVSALVLLAYALLAGPLNFYLAARQGKPLRALWRLPLWSAATLSVIAGLGILGKGISGRARRLTFVEAGAGMTTGAALRFRGFYAASSRDLTAHAGHRHHLLDVAADADELSRSLLVDRDGPRLQKLRTKPWQTVLIREDGFADLAGGISVVPDGEDYLVRNRAAADLLGVVVRAPGADARYFARIKDGTAVRVSSGKLLGSLGAPGPGGIGVVPLDAGSFAGTLDRDFPGLGRAWSLLEPALGGDTEWWPPDVPVLIGALDGGEGKLSDSGLRVDYDRLLLRVVGTGGVR